VLDAIEQSRRAGDPQPDLFRKAGVTG
jgi:hypothetical protein